MEDKRETINVGHRTAMSNGAVDLARSMQTEVPMSPEQLHRIKLQLRMCSHVECTNKGEYHPVLLLRAKNQKGKPSKAQLDFLVCENHKRTLKAADFLQYEEGWQKILATFAHNRLRKPHKASTGLEYVYAGDPGDPTQ